jgi:triple sensor domain protein
MTHDWLLVETLGAEPAVVAQGQRTENLVPISAFLRRHPNLMAIQTAINETVHAGKALSSLTAKSDRVIRTEVVQMTDGRIHGVHVWIGPLDEEPPDRVLPGPLKWDLTNGIATDTPESLMNSGLNPATEATQGRAFAEDLPARPLNRNEAKVVATAIKPEAGQTFCTTWDISDYKGKPITVGFVARVLEEADDTGRDGLICRAMNWRGVSTEPAVPPDDVGQQAITGEAKPGVHRALVDLKTWKLLKWLDEPCPFYDWHARSDGETVVHPDDGLEMASMATDFGSGEASRVLRLRTRDGGWTPIHVTVRRVEIDDDTSAGLLSLRLPEADEVNPPPHKVTRRAKARAEKAARS